jgi:hypothetical protein
MSNSKTVAASIHMGKALGECRKIVGSAQCEDMKFLASLRAARDSCGVMTLAYLSAAEPHNIAWLRGKAEQAWFRAIRRD